MNAQSQLELSTQNLKEKKNLIASELVDCIQEITNEIISIESKKNFLNNFEISEK